MKTHLQTAFLLLSVAIAGSVTAQQQPAQATSLEQLAASRPPQVAANTRLSSLLEEINAGSSRQSLWEQAAQTVLVVPSPELPSESLVAITEDMTVMCRILDNALAPALMPADAVKIFDPFTGRSMRDRPGTQGLYLDGYGALFFVQATFPLVPLQKDQEQPKSESSADPVWSRTVDELQGSPQKQPQAMQEYDAQKVESLKAAVIKSLRHAANLRVRGAQDAITVVLGVWSGAGYSFVYTTDQQGPARFESSGIDTSAVLVLRTTKSDVDAFAKGDLTPEQFTGKVQLLRSWTNSGRQAAPSTTLILPSTSSSGRGGRR